MGDHIGCGDSPDPSEFCSNDKRYWHDYQIGKHQPGGESLLTNHEQYLTQ